MHLFMYYYDLLLFLPQCPEGPRHYLRQKRAYPEGLIQKLVQQVCPDSEYGECQYRFQRHGNAFYAYEIGSDREKSGYHGNLYQLYEKAESFVDRGYENDEKKECKPARSYFVYHKNICLGCL